jgi:hypothetical protein
MADGFYEGPVCYQDGWHWTVVAGPDGMDVPGERLHLEDDADSGASRYRLATDDDVRSWHERKHVRFATVEMEDGSTTRVTAEENAVIQKVLAEMRGE